ncbi:MAG: 23S rRNA (guanosine(2251)-2'-O)-methyltransferase RlmB [Pseudomonadota bacterium]
MADVNKKVHQRRRPGMRGQRDATRRNAPDSPVIYGLHAVAFALRNPDRTITSLALTENAEHKLRDALSERNLTIERVRPKDLDHRLGADTVHQGAMAHVELLPEPQLEDLVARTEQSGPIIVLDQVTDPHNVGAVVRSAAVFGAAGLVMTRRHSPPLWGALAKVASGALELVPITLVQNLARALDTLAELGVMRIGLDSEGAGSIEHCDWSRPSAVILGAEGRGLRPSTRAACDTLAQIGTRGPITSLNVSNAAVVTLYEAARLRRSGD